MTVYAALISLFTVFMLSSCTSETVTVTTSNPDAEEILSIDPDADILQFDGIIYQTDIDWVEELELTQGEEVGEITSRTQSADDFEDGTANQLSEGTKLYKANERDDVLLAETDGELKYYYALVEG